MFWQCVNCGYPGWEKEAPANCPHCADKGLPCDRFVTDKAFEAMQVELRAERAEQDRQEREAHEKPLASLRGAKAPVVIGDRLPKHMDYALGEVIDSRSQQKRIMDANGLRWKSIDEERRQHGGMEKRGRICSYKGQKYRGLRDNTVRTKTGQEVQ